MVKQFVLVFITAIPLYVAAAQEQLLVEAKIYKTQDIDSSLSLKEILNAAELEHNPRMLTQYGVQAGLQFELSDAKQTNKSKIEMMIKSDKDSETYDIDINLISNRSKNISRIAEHPIGQQFIVSTVIEDVARIIQINVNEYLFEPLEQVDNDSQLVTYILEVNSNLQCERLDIELLNEDSSTASILHYKTSAFAAVDLLPGNYSFGNVVCEDSEGTHTFDLLTGNLDTITLTPDKVNYGGRMIFQQDFFKDTISVPVPVESCSTTTSSQGTSTFCSQTMSTQSKRALFKQIKAYAPQSTAQDVAIVQKALGLSKDSIVVVPLTQ